MSVVGIIPARAGSKGVKQKNIRLLCGYPLIAYSIVAAKLSKEISKVIISTDSKQIAEIAEKYGAEVPFLRPTNLAQDNSTDTEFMIHAIDWFEKNKKEVPKYWVHLRPTTPLRDPNIVDRAICEIKNKENVTSLRSAHCASESPFKWFQINQKGYFQGILSNENNDELNKARQVFPEAYIPDGYVDVLKTSFVKKTHMIHGDKVLAFVSPPCIEVDTSEDLELLEYQLSKKNNVVFEYLKDKYPQGE